MVSRAKADIKKLMSQGLTGREAARLILEDSWEVDHGRPGFLSEGDISRIQAGLKTQSDLQDYNRLIHAYRLVDYTLKDAHIHALEASKILLLACKELEVYWLEDHVRGLQLLLPAIVTQKQYDDLKAKQRASKLKELWPLEQVALEIARQMHPELEAQADEPDEEGYSTEFADFLREQHPEALQEAREALIAHIRAGRLQPVLLQPAEIEQLKKLNEQMEAISKAAGDGQIPDAWHALWQQEQQLLQAFYEAGKARAQSDIEIEAETLEDALSEYLWYSFCSGAELYELGLNTKYVDEYHPGLDDETSARPAGMMQSLSVAILQEPKPSDLDERGWYKESRLLESVSGYDRLATRHERLGISTGTMILQLLAQQASERIKAFLAIQATIEAVGQTMGITLTEDLESWYEDIQGQVSIFNALLQPASEHHRPPHYLGMPRLQQLKIGRLKPTARSLKYYKERMAIALGDEWLKEAIHTLEFRPSETASLADEMAKQIKAFQGAEAEEAEDGQ